MIMMMTVMTDDIQLTKDFILMMNYGIQWHFQFNW
jgi:hypothetical protein